MDSMKSILSLAAIVFLCVPLYAIAPLSAEIGPVVVSPSAGSLTEKALEAAGEKVDLEWFEKYTNGDKGLIDSLSPSLLELLPLQNAIAGVENDGAVSLYDLDMKVRISFAFDSDGLVEAIGIVEKKEKASD